MRCAVLLLSCYVTVQCSGHGAGPPSQAGVLLHSTGTSDKAPAVGADTDIEFPDVGDWVTYCDSLPKRSRARLSTLREQLLQQGFFEIDQLTGDRISHNDLSVSLGIGIGLAALIVRYAEEDVVQVRAGTFNMNLNPA